MLYKQDKDNFIACILEKPSSSSMFFFTGVFATGAVLGVMNLEAMSRLHKHAPPHEQPRATVRAALNLAGKH